nr:hypothetical protein [Trichosanthes kirilowii marnavirus]
MSDLTITATFCEKHSGVNLDEDKPVTPPRTKSTFCAPHVCRFKCVYCERMVRESLAVPLARAATFESWLEERFVLSPPASPRKENSLKQNKNSKNEKQNKNFKFQSGDYDNASDIFDQFEESFRDMPIWDKFPKPTTEWVMHHLEMAVLLCRDIQRSRDKEDVIRAIMHAIKHHLGVNSLLLSSMRGLRKMAFIVFEDFIAYRAQSGLEDSIDSTLNVIDKFTASQLLTLCAKLAGFVMSLTCFREYNINPMSDTKLFKDYSKLLANNPFQFGVTGLKTFLETTKCLLINLKKFWLTGDPCDIVFTSNRVSKWLSDYDKLQRDFLVLSNPEPFGVSVETFQKELADCIVDGQYLQKNRQLLEGFEQRVFDHKMSLLLDLDRNFKLRQLAQSHRTPPFSLLIHGPSSVGKSSVMQMLFAHFAKVSTALGKPLNADESFVYNRCTADEYWSGFSTYQWCIMLDDVAVVAPAKAVADETLEEIMRIVNIMPWTPPQAELERKGVYPVEPKLFLASTNVKTLNAAYWFSVPIAVQRRFPYVITVVPKPEYAKYNDGSPNPMLDSTKVPTNNGQYDDLWEFKVEKVIPGKSSTRPDAAYQLVGEKWNTADLLSWYGGAISDYYTECAKVSTANANYASAHMCAECFGTCSGECSSPRRQPQCGGAAESLYIMYTFICAIIVCILTHWNTALASQYFFGKYDYLLSGCFRYLRMAYTWEIILIRWFCQVAPHFTWGPAITIWTLAGLVVGSMSIAARQVLMLMTYAMDIFPALLAVQYARSYWTTAEGSIETVNAEWRDRFEIALRRSIQITNYRWIRFYHDGFRDLQRFIHWISLMKACARLQKKFYNASLAAKLAAFATVSVSLYTVYAVCKKGYETLAGMRIRSKTYEPEGSGFSSVKPKPLNEHANVWKWQEPPTLSAYDLSRQLLSRKGLSVQEQIELFKRNCFYFETIERDGRPSKYGRAFALGGQLYVTNAHFLWDRPQGMFITKCADKDAVGFRRKFALTYNENVFINETLDLCVFRVADLPNNPHVLEYFLQDDTQIPETNGYRLRREKDGEVTVERYTNIVADTTSLQLPDNTALRLKTYRAVTQNPTVDGDCGSPLLGEFEGRLIILGIHVSGGYVAFKERAFATRLNVKMLRTLISNFPPQAWVAPSAPVLESEKTGKLRVQSSIHPKSPFRFLQEKGSMEYYGSFEFRDGMGSKVGNTLLKDAFISATEGDGELSIKDLTRPPVMRGFVPKHAMLDHAKQTYEMVDYGILRACEESFFDDVMSQLPQSELDLITPLDLDTAINGADGITYLDAMKRSTSAGFPWCESKLKHMVFDVDENGNKSDKVDITQEMRDRYNMILERYAQSTQYHPVFRASLKDEPVPIAKAEKGNTRVFSCAPMDFSLVVRKFLLPVVRVMQRNAFTFEMAVGVQAQSYEWHLLYDHITKFGKDRIVAGDYSKFDKRMSPCFILAAFNLIKRICAKAGYSDDDLAAIDCIAHDIAFPTTDFFGDFVRFFGTNPSGHPLTVIINSLVNSIYVRYSYVLLKHCHVTQERLTAIQSELPVTLCRKYLSTFRKEVRVITYGDDILMAILRACGFFNHSTMAEALKTIGVEFTMADKNAKSRPFIHISEATFLKRSFVYSEELGAMVGPLDHSSISKMLTRCVKSKNYVAEQHMLQVVRSALDEYFWYGREVFESRRLKFFNICRDNDLLRFIDSFDPFPHWDELVNRYDAASIRFGRDNNRPVVKDDNHARQSEQTSAVLVPQWGCNRATPRAVNLTVKEAELFNSIDHVWLPKNQGYDRTGGILYQLSKSAECKQLLSNNLDTNTMGTTSQAHRIEVPANVGVAQSELVTGYTQQNQTTQFTDNSMEALYTQPNAPDSTFWMDKIATGELGDFLSRPTLVQTVTWTQGSSLGLVSNNVWTSYFSSPAITRKIENFAFFQGELHIKLMINSSPFLYGAVIAAYEPLKAFGYDLTASAATTSLRTMEFSQFPHVWLMPQNSQGGEIVFPFMYDLDWLDLTRATEVANMGALHLLEVEPLVSANGSAGQDVDIQVYVWFEKVQMSGLTHKAPLQMGVMSQVVDKAPQMWKAATAKSADEYAKRPISSIASTVAAVARPLSSIPGIGIFAKATSIGASAVGSIASLFGWTNPPNIANVEPVRQAPYHAFASAAISVPGDTMTLDPKAELCVDPRTVGLGDVDELTISNIAQRECYIGTCAWATTDAPQVTLAAMPVHPLHYIRAANATNGDEISMSPVGLLSRTFGYWRGDLIFRFKVIATEYHRGRLRLSWDPVSSLFGSSANNNTSLNRIVDISLEKDIEVRIPYNQARHWLATPNMLALGAKSYLRVKGDIFADFVDPETTNGMLTLLVLNALSAPEPTAGVNILIFVRGAPNLEFCVPKLPFDRTYSYFKPQSGEISISGAHDDNPDEKQFDVFFADPVRSLRTVLRRAHPNVTIMSDNAPAATEKLRYNIWTNTIFPYFNGYDPTSNFTASSFVAGSKPYAWALNTPFHMWIPCFKGIRGSMYWHYENQSQDANDRLSFEIRRELRDPDLAGTALAWQQTGFAVAAGNLSSLMFEETGSFDGANQTDTRSCAVLASPFNGEGKSVLLPNLFNYRFDTTRVSAFVTGQNRPRQRRERIRVLVRYAPRSTSATVARESTQFIRRYFSVGPDFNAFFFLCVPRIYRYASVPGAA